MKPIPAPSRLPGGVYATKQVVCSSLQEQMQLRSMGRAAFVGIMRIIRYTAARHTDLTLSYIWQDPQVLEKIKREILEKCPMLGEDYVDAWPITSYLRISLKKHKTAGYFRQQLEKKRLKHLNSHKLPAAMRSGMRAPNKVKSAQKHHARIGQAKKITHKVAFTPFIPRYRSSSPESEDDSDGAHATLRTLGLDSDEEDHDRRITSTAAEHGHGAHGAARGMQTRVHQNGANNAKNDDGDMKRPGAAAHPALQFIAYAPKPTKSPRKTSVPSADAVHMRPRASVAPGSSLVPPSEIKEMLLEYALPVGDAERITTLLASLGITNATGLRVLGRLTFCRTWLSEMREKGKLSEIQARVVRDLLDDVEDVA